MPIDIIDAHELARKNRKRTVLMDTRKIHSWLLYYEPGKSDEMHCHAGDQTFHCVSGECTMSFPDGGVAVMKPGMTALITGGSFYQLTNKGSEPMVLIGTRSGPKDSNQTILYASRMEKREARRLAADAAAAAGKKGE